MGINNISNIRYGIAPKLSQGSQKPRIEVFNPVEDNDDQKTTTTILFDNNFQFLAFGTKALQRYAEVIDDGETALLFQTVIHLFKYSIKWHYSICRRMLKA